MSYLVIDDFRLGMDRRKSRVAGTAGALWEGINGHINRGGDFERRKKFVAKYALPAGTFGLSQVNKRLYVFGSAATPGGMPPSVTYQRLQHPTGANMTGIIDVTTFSSKIYAVAKFDNGDIFHYYDGTRVASWDAIAHAIGSNSTIAAALANKVALDPRYICSAVGSVITIEAAVAGTAFTISSSAVNHGGTNDQTLTLALLQANVAAAAETRATFQVRVITGTDYYTGPGFGVPPFFYLILNGNFITLTHIEWKGDATSTAAFAATVINNIGATSTTPGVAGVRATSSGDTITITAPPGYGATANSWAVSAYVFDNMIIQALGVNYSGNSTLTYYPSLGNMAGGVSAVVPVAEVYTATVGGTFDDADVFTLTIDGIDYVVTGLASGMGITAITYQGKVYSVTSSLLEFCALNDPTTWGSGTGFGFINVTNQNSDNDALVGICQYQNRIAIFSRNNIQIWIIAVDPASNTFQQSVQNTGALSIRSILQYGNIDVFYLNDQGVRSMRARDSSNAPAVNDVGVSIDAFLQAYIATLSGSQISRACAVIEPLDGRYWLALHNRIFVYSFFPGSKISAWTYYDLTDEIGSTDISEMVRAGNRVYLRAGNTIYLYGGDTNAVYPNDNEIEATVSLPFLSAEKPATVKGIHSFDIACTGTWLAKLLPIPADDTVELEIGTFSKPTFSCFAGNPIEMPAPLFAAKLTCNKGGPATISKLVFHFDAENQTG